MKFGSAKNIRNIIIISVLLVCAFVFRAVAFKTDDYFIATLLLTLRNVVHIIMIIVWSVSIYMRVVSKQIRNMLMTVGALMIAWLIIRTCKLEFLY
ncbi:MAG: hypothetical protein IJB70_07835, partial [Clostridia bacterium]|nr:hypothetical protein [Clostridia bacterium]